MQEKMQTAQTPEKEVETATQEADFETAPMASTSLTFNPPTALSNPVSAATVARQINQHSDSGVRRKVFQTYQGYYGNRFANQVARLVKEESAQNQVINRKKFNGDREVTTEVTKLNPSQSSSKDDEPSAHKITTTDVQSEGRWRNKEKTNNDNASEKEKREKIESAIKNTTEIGVKTSHEEKTTGPNKNIVLSNDKTETFSGTRDLTENKTTKHPAHGLIPSSTEHSNSHTLSNGSENIHTVTTPHHDKDNKVVHTNEVVTTEKYGNETTHTTSTHGGLLSGYGAKTEVNSTGGFSDKSLHSYSRNYSHTQEGYKGPEEHKESEVTSFKVGEGKKVKVNSRSLEYEQKGEGTLGYHQKKEYGHEGHKLDLEYGAGAKGEATGTAKLGRDGATLKGEASVKAGLYGEVNGTHNFGKYAKVDASGKALVGAEASGGGDLSLSTNKASLSGHASAFAGAKVEGTASGGLGYGGHQFLVVTGKAQASAGIGGSANFTLSYNEGKFKVGAGLAATLGLGAGASGEITFSPVQLAMALMQVTHDTNKAVQEYCLLIKKIWNELTWTQIYTILSEAAQVYGNAMYDYLGIAYIW